MYHEIFIDVTIKWTIFFIFFILVFHILKVKFDPLLYFSSRNRKSERYLSIARQSWTGQVAVKVLLTTCLADPVSSHPFPISSSTSSLNKTHVFQFLWLFSFNIFILKHGLIETLNML